MTDKLTEEKLWGTSKLIDAKEGKLDPADIEWIQHLMLEAADELNQCRDRLRWVPVSERLPERAGYYDVGHALGEAQGYARWMPKKEQWKSPSAQMSFPVTHWKERPQPPQQEQQEQSDERD